VLAGALATGCGDAPPGPPIQVVRIERDLLEPGAWRPLRGRPDAPPLVEILCPNVKSEVDGADMPALVLPPPGEVELVIAAGSTPARLVARAGVDQFAFKHLETAGVPRAQIAFEVRAGERVLAREVIELVQGQHARNAWVDLGGKEGLALDGPVTLTLRTEALLPDGTELPVALHAGFGGLRLERRFERERTRSSPKRPNVVLVVMDTLRADRLSAYGYERPTAPRLERLAARGVRFDACYSTASWTWPATASLLTGLTPMEHGLVGEGSSFLPEQAETLAEALQSAGFTTAAWSGNPIVSAARNFDQGFERYTSAPEGFQKTDVFFEDVRAFLRASAETRFFLYLHLTEPHEPLVPLDEGARSLAADVPLEFRAKLERVRHETDKGEAVGPDGALRLDEFVSPAQRAWAGELYDASVWSGDHWLGALMDELEALALDDRTIVAFTSDHGEELFERGFLWHGQSLRRELVHVPLVVAGPGVPAGKSHAGLVSSRLVAPMLASLAGVPFAGDEAARRALTDPRAAEELVLFTTTKGFWKGKNRQRLLGLTDGKWKLELAPHGSPWSVTEPAPGGDVELFRVDEDPAERADLAARHPEEVARLRKLLLERVDALEKLRIGVDVPAGEATRTMLDGLGYGGGK
jgi:arylsulfatase A-like enzyme